jgi:uncharacterized protein (DUF302 family)
VIVAAQIKQLEANVVLTSRFPIKDTIDRLVIALQQQEMLIYARINRQVESKWYGLVTRPLEFIIFDDPRLSGPLVEREPIAAICFPARIIAWEDANGVCLVAFRDLPAIIKKWGWQEAIDWPDLAPVISRALSE